METDDQNSRKKSSTKARKRSSVSSAPEIVMEDSYGKRQRRKRFAKRMLQKSNRSVTCVECGKASMAASESVADAFETWSEKYFHVAEFHIFRKFRCPYAPCQQTCKTAMKLNVHIDQAHRGSRKVTDPDGYHDEVVQKVKLCFPILDDADDHTPKKKTRSSASADQTIPSVLTSAPVARGSSRDSSSSGNRIAPALVRLRKPRTDRKMNNSGLAGPQSTTETNSNISPPTAELVELTYPPAVLLATPTSPTLFPSYVIQSSAPTEVSSSAIISVGSPLELQTLTNTASVASSEPAIEDEHSEPFLALPEIQSTKKQPSIKSVEKVTTDGKEDEDDFLSFPK